MPCEAEAVVNKGMDVNHRCDEGVVLVEEATIKKGALEARGKDQYGLKVPCLKQSRRLAYHPAMARLLYQSL
jgi:hypothetical protein